MMIKTLVHASFSQTIETYELHELKSMVTIIRAPEVSQELET
jgi:hypothetical protein